MQELFSNSPLTFVAMVFILSLLIGSFLNVVIYRLPIMMQREWRFPAIQLHLLWCADYGTAEHTYPELSDTAWKMR